MFCMGRTQDEKDLQFCIYVNCRNRIVTDQFNFIRDHASHLQPENFSTFAEAKNKIKEMQSVYGIPAPVTLLENFVKESRTTKQLFHQRFNEFEQIYELLATEKLNNSYNIYMCLVNNDKEKFKQLKDHIPLLNEKDIYIQHVKSLQLLTNESNIFLTDAMNKMFGFLKIKIQGLRQQERSIVMDKVVDDTQNQLLLEIERLEDEVMMLKKKSESLERQKGEFLQLSHELRMEVDELKKTDIKENPQFVELINQKESLEIVVRQMQDEKQATLKINCQYGEQIRCISQQLEESSLQYIELKSKLAEEQEEKLNQTNQDKIELQGQISQLITQNHILNSQLVVQMNKYTQLSNDHEQIKQKNTNHIEDLQNQLLAAKQRIKDLNEELIQSKQNEEQAKQVLNIEKERVGSQLNAVKNELILFKQREKVENQSLVNERDQLRKVTDQQNERIKLLASDVQTSFEQMKELKDRYNQEKLKWGSQDSNQQGYLQQLQQEIEEKTTFIWDQNKVINKLNSDISDLESALIQTQNEMAQYLGQSDQGVEQLEKKIESLNEQIEKIKTDSENQMRNLEIRYQSEKEVWSYEEQQRIQQTNELTRQIQELQEMLVSSKQNMSEVKEQYTTEKYDWQAQEQELLAELRKVNQIQQDRQFEYELLQEQLNNLKERKEKDSIYFQQQISLLETEKEHLKIKFDELSNEYSELKVKAIEEKNWLEANIEIIQNRFQEEAGQYRDSRASLQSETQQQLAVVEQQKQRLRELEELKQNQEKMIESLQQEIENIQIRLNRANEAHDEQVKISTKLQDQLQTYEKQLEEQIRQQNQENQQLNQQLQRSRQECERLKLQISNLQEDKNQLRKSLENHEKLLENTKDINSKDRQSLLQKLELSNYDVTRLQKTNQSLQQSVNKLEKDVRTKEQEVQNITERLQQYQLSQSEQQSVLQAQLQAFQQQRNEKLALEKQLNEITAEQKNLTRSNQEYQRVAEKAQEENKLLNSQIKDLQAEMKSDQLRHKEQISDYQGQIERLDQTLEQSQIQFNKLQKANEELLLKKNQLESNCFELKTSLKQLEFQQSQIKLKQLVEQEQSSNEQQDIMKQNQLLQNEIVALKRRSEEDVQKNKKVAQEQQSFLEKQLKVAKDSNIILNKQVNDLKEEIKQLNGRIDKLEIAKRDAESMVKAVRQQYDMVQEALDQVLSDRSTQVQEECEKLKRDNLQLKTISEAKINQLNNELQAYKHSNSKISDLQKAHVYLIQLDISEELEKLQKQVAASENEKFEFKQSLSRALNEQVKLSFEKNEAKLQTTQLQQECDRLKLKLTLREQEFADEEQKLREHISITEKKLSDNEQRLKQFGKTINVLKLVASPKNDQK